MTSKIKVNILADGGDNSIITSDGAGSFTASSGLASSVQSVGGIQNTPAFHAYKSSNSNLTDDVTSKISIDTELFDSDGKYDVGNYRFTPTVAGKYFIYGQVNLSCNAGEQYHAGVIMIYKNGSEYSRFTVDPNNNSAGKHNQVTASIGMIIDFNSTDYVEIYALADVGAGTPNVTGDGSASPTFFGGYKVIGA
jgi:hypothetical protein